MSGAQDERAAERARMIGEIRRVAEACGGVPPGAKKFERLTGLPRSAWLSRFWSRWSDALRDTGFEPNPRTSRLNDENMLAQFAEVARSIGRIPVFSDLDLYRRSGRGQIPHRVAYIDHFGGKKQLLARLKDWSEEDSGRADIAAMLREIPADNGTTTSVQASKTGSVYLLRCGTRFKIGCSLVMKKRVRSIQNMLPEPATLVHSIRTDDPLGIERYWHRRFAGKRLRGEWFMLNSADVAAFRKWRCM